LLKRRTKVIKFLKIRLSNVGYSWAWFDRLVNPNCSNLPDYEVYYVNGNCYNRTTDFEGSKCDKNKKKVIEGSYPNSNPQCNGNPQPILREYELNRCLGTAIFRNC
jgi:hypothetical protein